MPHQPRAELVARLARDLEHSTAPRLQVLIMLIGAGAAACLASVLLLWSPAETFELMAPRYAVAALAGYLVFVGLIRLWIAFQRPVRDQLEDLPDVNPVDVLEVVTDLPLPRGNDARMFTGGRSGGGGASQEWAPAGAHSSGGACRGWLPDIDLDEGIVWLVIAAACAACGLAGLVYVIYTAPVLLAEVALDAAIVSALYRRLRSDQRGYWLSTVLRRTLVPAMVVLVFAFATGFALQQAAPEARSIGAVIQTVTRR